MLISNNFRDKIDIFSQKKNTITTLIKFKTRSYLFLGKEKDNFKRKINIKIFCNKIIIFNKKIIGLRVKIIFFNFSKNDIK